jgi:hypothetical protein
LGSYGVMIYRAARIHVWANFIRIAPYHKCPYYIDEIHPWLVSSG